MNVQEWLIKEYSEYNWRELFLYSLEDTLIGLHILIPEKEKNDIELANSFVMGGEEIKYGEIDKEALENEIQIINEYDNIKEWHTNNMCHIHR